MSSAAESLAPDMKLLVAQIVDLVGSGSPVVGCVALLTGVVGVAGLLLTQAYRQIKVLRSEIERLTARVERGEQRISQLEHALQTANVPLPPPHHR